MLYISHYVRETFTFISCFRNQHICYQWFPCLFVSQKTKLCNICSAVRHHCSLLSSNPTCIDQKTSNVRSATVCITQREHLLRVESVRQLTSLQLSEFEKWMRSSLYISCVLMMSLYSFWLRSSGLIPLALRNSW